MFLLLLLLVTIRKSEDVVIGDEPDFLIGINYFAGWWKPHPNKWFEPWNQTVDWRHIYPERVPLLGEYNTQDSMDKEIESAANYGIDFFQILYYDDEPNARFLNRGLTNFISSKKGHLMKFYIEWCNSPRYWLIDGKNEFEKIIKNDWMPAFKHPSYLKIDNKLVFKLINAGAMLQMCNQSAKCVNDLLDTLRERVKDETGLDMLIGGGTGANWTVASEVFMGYKYDFTNTYMDGPFDEYEKYKVHEWDLMSEWTETQRMKHETDKIPYVPYLGVGWDPRPWREPRPSFGVPTKEQWRRDLRKIKNDLEETKNFGIRLESGGMQKIFNIYAWNEFGEGGFMAPVKGLQYDRLAGVKEVFGR